MTLQLQFIILPIIFLIALILAVACFVGAYYWDSDGLLIGGGCTSVIAACSIIILAIFAMPYNVKYWDITYPSGTVAETSYQGGVVIDGDSGTVYVIELEGSNTQYVVNDDRATKYKVGDHIDLACTLQWNYGAKDQHNCTIAK